MDKNYKADFEFSTDLLSSFFKKRDIVKRFQLIEESKLTGWENWLKIELAMYISKQPDIAEFGVEWRFNVDQRTSTSSKQESAAIDLCFRKKHCAANKFIGVELKQAPSYETCISNIVNDVKKVYSLRKKANDGNELRHLFVLGIFQNQEANQEAIKNRIEKKMEAVGGLYPEAIVVEEINETDLMWCFF